MARIEIDPNYSSPTFPRGTAATDLFKKEDVQALAAAMSAHVHDGAGKGLPISGVSPGVITSAMIADGTISTQDIAAAAITNALLAKPSVSTPELVDACVTAVKIAGHAVSRVFTQSFSAVISTGSASFVSTGDVINWTPQSAQSDILIFYQGSFAESAAGALAQFYVAWTGSNMGGPVIIQQGLANAIFGLHMLGYCGPSTHNGALGQPGLYWTTNTPNLSSSWTRNLTVLEMNK